jgi:pimeloyl-ACP methyl ester carboxylesterase
LIDIGIDIHITLYLLVFLHLCVYSSGGWLTWELGLLHPEVFVALCSMSVPYMGRGDRGFLAILKDKFGDPTPSAPGGDEERRKARFMYMLHHNLPRAAAMYDANAREALYRIYGYLPGVACEAGTPEVTDSRMFVPAVASDEGKPIQDLPAPGMWERFPRPCTLPVWLPQDDFDYYVSEFVRKGFAGGLNFYRTMDLNHGITTHLRGVKVKQPVLFIAGDMDLVVLGNGGVESVSRGLDRNCVTPPTKVFYPGVGHWVQQEKAEEVSRELVAWLDKQQSTLCLPSWASRL